MTPDPALFDTDPLTVIRDSALFDPEWYLARYPDVARSGMEPAAHFHLIGSGLGRDPGPGFSTRGYLALNPDVAQAGVPALLHYLRSGRREGRPPHPPVIPPARGPGRAGHLRTLLETGGLDAGPRAALAALANAPGPESAAACETLALHALNAGDRAEAETYLDLWEARGAAPETLVPLRICAAMASGDRAAAKARYRDGPPTPDLHLAATRIGADAEARLPALAAAFAAQGLAAPRLRPPERRGLLRRTALPGFDRLDAGTEAAPPQSVPVPRVSVLMAVHDGAATLPAALRALARQSLADWELIVVAAASRDRSAALVEAAAATDPRIRLLRLARNGGAYAARNAGLAEARGRWVTLMDADDWAHPEKLARQVAHLEARPWLLGCLASQARLAPDLRLSRWTGTGAMIHEDLSSLMLPREILRDHLGGWDALRVSADSELLRRVRRLFGETSVAPLPEMLSLQRDAGDNATADPATGMGWFYYGARREYFEAQEAYHATAPSLRYPPGGPRPFPVPAILQPGWQPGKPGLLRLDRVYAGLFQRPDAGLSQLLAWLDEDAAAGRTAGLVPLWSSRLAPGDGLAMQPALRARVDGTVVQVLTYGMEAEAEVFRRLPGQVAEEPQRYLPRVRSGGRAVLEPGRPPAAG